VHWYGWVLVALGVYVGLLVILSLVSIHPYRIPFWISPGTLGAPQEEVVYGSADGQPLRGWWMQNDGSNKVAILAHGYVMNRCELAPEAFWLWQRGFSCLLIDLRCHGKSGGRRCGLGAYEKGDVQAAVQFARGQVKDAKILLVGSSMGSVACAMALADDNKLADALVLDSAFGRLPSAILGWWRFVGGNWLAVLLSPIPLVAWPLAGFNPFKIDVRTSLLKIGPETPVLMIHGRKDTLALPSEASRNFEAIRGPKQELWFDRCGHSEGRWLYPELYRAALQEFLDKHGFTPAERRYRA